MAVPKHTFNGTKFLMDRRAIVHETACAPHGTSDGSFFDYLSVEHEFLYEFASVSERMGALYNKTWTEIDTDLMSAIVERMYFIYLSSGVALIQQLDGLIDHVHSALKEQQCSI